MNNVAKRTGLRISEIEEVLTAPFSSGLFETNFVNVFIERLSPNGDKLTFGGSHTETLLRRFVPLKKTMYAS